MNVSQLPDALKLKQSGSVNLVVKESNLQSPPNDCFRVQSYRDLRGIRHSSTDVCFLDREAIKLLLTSFPQLTPFVLVRLSIRSSWIVGLPGLLRRLALGQLKIQGITRLSANDKLCYWLVLHVRKFAVSDQQYSYIDGVISLLQFLDAERIEYVVLRFFDKLPYLYRTGGDLDLLLSDDSVPVVRKWLVENPLPIYVDLNGVSAGYYPLRLALKIIQSAVEGPCGSKIPGPEEAFFSFIYHALYHKGLLSGIPTSDRTSQVNQFPSNNYACIIQRMSDDLGIPITLNMECLDDFLHEQGWGPGYGNFARSAIRNEWVRQRFLADQPIIEVGLGVLILKRKAVQLGLVDRIVSELRGIGYSVLRNKLFESELQKIAKVCLRGGNWNAPNGEYDIDLEPALALVIFDTKPYSLFQATKGDARSRVTESKKILREVFDTDSSSLVHSTDTPIEAWEYIEVCFPEEAKLIRSEVEEYLRYFKISLVDRIRFYIFDILDFKSKLRQCKTSIVGRLMGDF